MSDTRREITLYYNVDGGYWCDSQGNFGLPSMMPVFRKGELVAIKLTLVHNYGDGAESLVSYADTHDFTFVVYDNEHHVMFHSLSTDINSVDGLAIWDEADSTKGKFIILCTCSSTALGTLLAEFPTSRVNMEFVVLNNDEVCAVYPEKVYCVQTLTAGAIVDEEIIMSGALTVVDVPIGVGLSETSVIFDNATYQIVAMSLESPATALENVSILNYELTLTGFTVHLSTEVTDAGYILHYSYVRKV